ncbi:unnamed protein product [Closterium sp. NIES-54]
MNLQGLRKGSLASGKAIGYLLHVPHVVDCVVAGGEGNGEVLLEENADGADLAMLKHRLELGPNQVSMHLASLEAAHEGVGECTEEDGAGTVVGNGPGGRLESLRTAEENVKGTVGSDEGVLKDAANAADERVPVDGRGERSRRDGSHDGRRRVDPRRPRRRRRRRGKRGGVRRVEVGVDEGEEEGAEWGGEKGAEEGAEEGDEEEEDEAEEKGAEEGAEEEEGGRWANQEAQRGVLKRKMRRTRFLWSQVDAFKSRGRATSMRQQVRLVEGGWLEWEGR